MSLVDATILSLHAWNSLQFNNSRISLEQETDTKLTDWLYRTPLNVDHLPHHTVFLQTIANKGWEAWLDPTHLWLLWPAADSHHLLNKLLLLQLDRLLHSDLTEGVHWVLDAIRHHAAVVWLHTNLRKKKTAGQSHYRGARWQTIRTAWIWGQTVRKWAGQVSKGEKVSDAC